DESGRVRLHLVDRCARDQERVRASACKGGGVSKDPMISRVQTGVDHDVHAFGQGSDVQAASVPAVQGGAVGIGVQQVEGRVRSQVQLVEGIAELGGQGVQR